MKLGFGSNVCRAIVRSAAGVIIEERVQHNMVLDQGRANIHGNGIFGTGSITHACAVGSSAQSITAATTQLNDEEARVVCGSRSMLWSGTGPGDNGESMIASFSSGQVGGKTLHTWGFSHSDSAGANINTAGVFEDSGGSASPIVVPSGASLTLEYKFLISAVGSGAGPINISGAGNFTDATWSFLWSFGSNTLRSLSTVAGLGSGTVFLRELSNLFAEASFHAQADGQYGIRIAAEVQVSSPGECSHIDFLAAGTRFYAINFGPAGGPTFSSGDVLSLGDLKISW